MDSLPTAFAELSADLSQLLKETIGTSVEIESLQFLVQKRDYAVLLVKTRQPPIELVVKLAGSNTTMSARFEQSAFLLRLLATHTTVPTPEVIAADSSRLMWPWRYLICVHVPGVEWAALREQLSPDARVAVYAQVGDAVAQLHNLEFPTFGEIDPHGTVLGNTLYFDALRARAQRKIKARHLATMFLSILEQHAELFAEVDVPALCHDDLHKHNLLFHPWQGHWRLATVLDFDKAWAGSPESDLARLELWETSLSSHFWDTYCARRTLSPAYTARLPIYQLLWCLEYAKATTQHLATTNRLCVRLGMPTLDTFM